MWDGVHTAGELDGALERAGAVLIEGPKACGKTETATRRAASIVHLDADPSVPGHLADPSLALALVGGDAAALRRDLGFAGQLFESLVVHDLRVLAQPLGGDVFHARDSAGREIDVIIQFPSGRWAGFEVKLGASADTVDAAAAGLLGFAANVDADDPVLTVVTGTGPSYRRADGVNVVAIGALGP